jgi:NIMA (never in mitosis gene a)-related kinase
MQEQKKQQEKEGFERYKMVQLLGKGSCGQAFLVRCERKGGLAVIKEIDITKMSEAEKKDALQEAKILESLRHPNIIRFHEVYKTVRGHLCIVMDYADGDIG